MNLLCPEEVDLYLTDNMSELAPCPEEVDLYLPKEVELNLPVKGELALCPEEVDVILELQLEHEILNKNNFL